MQKINFYSIIVILLLICNINVNAQTAFSATSNSAVINGNHYEYVIGEMTSVSTEANSKIIITQGYLQPNQSNKPADVTDYANSGITVYPNPTQDVVNIKLSTEANADYQLFDVSGKVVASGKESNKSFFSLNLQAFAKGNYYLMLITNQNGKEEKYSFKIQKK